MVSRVVSGGLEDGLEGSLESGLKGGLEGGLEGGDASTLVTDRADCLAGVLGSLPPHNPFAPHPPHSDVYIYR